MKENLRTTHYSDGTELVDGKGSYAYFWSSTGNAISRIYYTLDYSSSKLRRIKYDASYGRSVRCVKN